MCITILALAVPAPETKFTHRAELIQTHRDIQPPPKSLAIQFKISCNCEE